MKILNFFKRKNTFQPDQLCKVWVYAETTEATLYVEVERVEGDYVKPKYLDREKMENLKRRDPSFIFPEFVNFRDCRHIAYDEIKRCYELMGKAQSGCAGF